MPFERTCNRLNKDRFDLIRLDFCVNVKTFCMVATLDRVFTSNHISKELTLNDPRKEDSEKSSNLSSPSNFSSNYFQIRRPIEQQN